MAHRKSNKKNTFTKRIKSGDTVRVVQGKEAGKQGKVLRVDKDDDRVVVERVNFIKRHVRPTQQNPQGGVIEREAPLHVSDVMLVCPGCDQPTRTGMRFENDDKVRFCKKCNITVDRG